MSKAKIGIIICLVLLFVFGTFVGYSFINDNNKPVTDNSNKVDFLDNEEYFNGKVVNINDDIIKIDDKEIYKKNGYYLMNVKEDETDFYCNFVAAVQKKLGVPYADALDVCKSTVDGIIDFGVIHAVKKDGYTELTVNYEEKTKTLSSNTQTFGSIISIKSEDVIKDNNILISDVTYGYTKSLNLYNICGYISGADSGVLNVSVYNQKKEMLKSEEYSYSREGNFCVNFFDLTDDIYYYSFS